MKPPPIIIKHYNRRRRWWEEWVGHYLNRAGSKTRKERAKKRKERRGIKCKEELRWILITGLGYLDVMSSCGDEVGPRERPSSTFSPLEINLFYLKVYENMFSKFSGSLKARRTDLYMKTVVYDFKFVNRSNG
jgi:hypothetical protein